MATQLTEQQEHQIAARRARLQKQINALEVALDGYWKEDPDRRKAVRSDFLKTMIRFGKAWLQILGNPTDWNSEWLLSSSQEFIIEFEEQASWVTSLTQNSPVWDMLIKDSGPRARQA